MQTNIENLYSLKIRSVWEVFKHDSFAFKMACLYLFFEYVRPQTLVPYLDVYSSWAQSFIILAFIGWIFEGEDKKIHWSGITTNVFFYLFIVILSSYYAIWPEISWNKFNDYFSWVVIFFVLTQVVTTRERFYIILLIFLLSSFKLSFFGARTWAMRGFAFTKWGLMGPQGFFQNSGELSIQMVVFAPIALFFTIGIKDHLKKWKTKLLYLMPITAVMTVLGASSRGGQIALFSQIFMLIGISKHRLKILIATIAILMISYQLLPNQQKVRFEDMGKDDTSIQRLLYWKHGLQMIKEHPLLGVGYYNFVPYYKLHYNEDIIIPHHAKLGIVELPHNIFIQIGTDTGFTGLTIYFGLIIMAFYHTSKIGKEAVMANDLFIYKLTKGMNLALVGYLVAGQFVSVAYYPFFWMHITFVAIIDAMWKNERRIAQFL
ncbi:O-antigen ligase family protein [Desulfosarcina ovata]|nr:O-antigen ligase family protein [Desulfosarcina ovata]